VLGVANPALLVPDPQRLHGLPSGPDFGPNAKYFKYDPAEARKLLAAAGYPDGLKVDMIASPAASGR